MATLGKTLLLATMALVAMYSQYVTAARSYYHCPDPNPKDYELIHEHVYIPSKFFAWSTYYYSFPKQGFNTRKISCIHVKNRAGENGAEVLLLSGGVDHYHVSFKFTSRINHSINLNVYIYGRDNQTRIFSTPV